MWWMKTKGIEYETEYIFHPVRKWRFDIAIPSHKIYLEYEGIMTNQYNSKVKSQKSGHLTPTGYTNNCRKYNQASILGWTQLRYTALNIGEAIEDLKNLIK